MLNRIAQVLAVATLLVGTASIPSSASAQSTEESSEEQLGRGKRWVRSHEFHLSALTQSEPLFDAAEYRGAGLNTLLAWKNRPQLFEKSKAANLPIHYHVYQHMAETTDGYVEHVRDIVTRYPGCTGVLFHDEPRATDMKRVREVGEALKRSFPDLLVYSNAMPKGAVNPAKYGFGEDAPRDFYEKYVELFAEQVNGDILMVDIYPLGGSGHSRVYYETLALFREQGLKHQVPYWVFIQAYDHGGKKRRPSESDLRFQLFVPLALGFTGISYFTYDPALGPGLIDGKRTKTPLYYHAGRANMEVKNLGAILRHLDSTNIAFVQGRHKVDGVLIENAMPPMPPSGFRKWPELQGKPDQLLDISFAETGEGKNALIGMFTDSEGQDYFMVTNLFHEKDTTANEAAMTITLTFSPSTKSITRFSRESGTPEQLVVRDGKLELRLPGGTGDLFKLH
jgi:hypothetical protein